jgi:shikimate dehydrogenase
MSMSRLTIGRETTVCMSLAARPGTFGSRFHNHLYQALEMDWIYKAFTTQDLPAAMAGVRALGIRGCAISMPFKEACIPWLDALAPSASTIDSVNTVVNDRGRLTGHNTDYAAVSSLLADLKLSPNARFALCGSGGMAKAVAWALRNGGFTSGIIVARNQQAGRALANATGFAYTTELREQPSLLINATPLGMAGGTDAQALPFSEQQVQAAEVVFEVVAMPAVTPLLKLAQTLGKRVVAGSQILGLQALEQFVLYTGIRPSDVQVSNAIAHALQPA